MENSIQDDLGVISKNSIIELSNRNSNMVECEKEFIKIVNNYLTEDAKKGQFFCSFEVSYGNRKGQGFSISQHGENTNLPKCLVETKYNAMGKLISNVAKLYKDKGYEVHYVEENCFRVSIYW